MLKYTKIFITNYAFTFNSQNKHIKIILKIKNAKKPIPIENKNQLIDAISFTGYFNDPKAEADKSTAGK